MLRKIKQKSKESPCILRILVAYFPCSLGGKNYNRPKLGYYKSAAMIIVYFRGIFQCHLVA